MVQKVIIYDMKVEVSGSKFGPMVVDGWPERGAGGACCHCLMIGLACTGLETSLSVIPAV